MGEAESSIPIHPPQIGKALCPRCGATLRLPDGSQGRKVRCPTCGHKWRNGDKALLPSGASDPEPPLPKPREIAAMLEAAAQTFQPQPKLPGDSTLSAKVNPAWLRRRPRGPEFEPIDCAVIVSDLATGAEDRYSGLIFVEGLLLSRGGERVLIPVGAAAAYEGDDRLTVELHGKKQGLRLLRSQTRTNTLAFDLARFLNRQAEALDIEHYYKPTYLYLIALLPLGLLLFTLFSPLWSALGVLLFLLCLGLSKAERLTYHSKLLGVFGLAVTAYLVWGLVEFPVFLRDLQQRAKPTATATQG